MIHRRHPSFTICLIALAGCACQVAAPQPETACRLPSSTPSQGVAPAPADDCFAQAMVVLYDRWVGGR